MNRRVKFFLITTPILWLVMVAPVTILLSWWMSFATLKALLWSLLAAPLVSVWLYLSFQTSNLKIKWPATQVLGWTTILMNVVIVCAVLLFFLPPVAVAVFASVLWIVTGSYAVWQAHNIQNTELSVTSNKLTRTHRLLHISDVHAGSRSVGFIHKVVNQATDHKPDAVLITGDLVDSSAVDKDYLAPLNRLDCPAYLCLGNHERYVDLQKAIDAIEANKITVLRDRATAFGELNIIGIDDTDSPQQIETVLPTIGTQAEQFQILMYHRPNGFEAAADYGIDLMLSGHTHAGQVWPFGILVKRAFPRTKGRFQLDDSILYVSQGTGTWGPIMRLGTKSEMTLITLKPHP